MSYICGAHGWRNGQNPCPVCLSVANVPEAQRDHAGMAHREPTKDEIHRMNAGAVNATRNYLGPLLVLAESRMKKPTLWQRLKCLTRR